MYTPQNQTSDYSRTPLKSILGFKVLFNNKKTRPFVTPVYDRSSNKPNIQENIIIRISIGKTPTIEKKSFGIKRILNLLKKRN